MWLYRAVASFINAAGKTHFGECPQLGIGVEKDILRAVCLYSSAASSGSVAARNNPAYCYWNGLDVAKTKVKLRRCILKLLKLVCFLSESYGILSS